MSDIEAALVAAPAEPCIFAVASGSGRAAIAVLRLSGARTGSAIEALCRTCPPPRRASLRSLRDGAGLLIDRALVLWMPGPDSYTGEDCAELHVHGGHAVVDAVAGALIQAGARPADPGEFSRRAFLNGRMDLLEAEGVADLVEAETEAQRRQALRQMQGEASRLYRGWADRLLSLLAAQEALVDFPDEDLPASVETELRQDVAALAATLRVYLDDGQRGERLRDGVIIAITGQPNVGKSSLMNALCERDVAIVSPRAGTTRDVLEARLVLRGVPVTLLDTAGLRPSDDAIEQEGVRRARNATAGADLVVHLLDPTLPDMASAAGAMRVSSKADLGLPAIGDAIACSAETGQGMADLREQLGVAVERLVRNSGPPAITRARHRAGLMAALTHLEAAGLASLPELRAEALRLGYQALGRLTGAGDVETILDEVFGRFCIGK